MRPQFGNDSAGLTAGLTIEFVCPSCKERLLKQTDDWICEAEALRFSVRDGIPDFILPHRRSAVEEFLTVYNTVRTKEKWGSNQAEYYRLLPFQDITGIHRSIWRIRSKTFRSFSRDLSASIPDASLILDIGAGNGWLSNRLAEEGHGVIALDINLSDLDGLGAAKFFLSKSTLPFLPVRAEFDHLPFCDPVFDAVIFNASVHYSGDPVRTIRNTLRLVKENGALYIMDSPIFHNAAEGNRMLEDKVIEIGSKAGRRVSMDNIGSFLNPAHLNDLESQCVIEYIDPNYGMRLRIRRTLARVLRRRELASFGIIKVLKKHLAETALPG